MSSVLLVALSAYVVTVTPLDTRTRAGEYVVP